ncbi:MAG TPA: alpha/beta hydrolase-fold protein [Prolixibacteraceae bacterium]|nr:alpha/beta hydrolase-fold protein [Prolixibacteraceae bacterium]
MKAIIITLLVLSFHYIQSIAQPIATLNPSSKNKEQVVAPLPANVTSELIWSEKVNDEFKIFISLPPDYDSLRLEKYPVVYFLDGGSNTFHNINAEYMAGELIPQVITVGIGYPGSTQRDRDYTYGFINFYQFLQQELIPMMDKRYHTDPLNRTLFGHSYGGICVLFTLFEYHHWEDILFHNLIAASPSIWYDGKIAYVRERTLYEQTRILPVNFYMSVGSMEGFMVSDMNRMQQTLMDHNYEYLALSCHVYEGKDHKTNKEITYRDGIQWVLDQEIRIPTSTGQDVPVQASLALGIYPNPVTDRVHIVLPSGSRGKKVTCRITDSMGKQVKTITEASVQQNSLQVPVPDLLNGVYIVQLTCGNDCQALKFVKH